MNKLKKLGLIVGVCIGSLLLFLFFLLYNFPYQAVAKRIAYDIKKNYNAVFSVADIQYRFPLTLRLKGVSVQLPAYKSSIRCPKISFRLRVINFAKKKAVQIGGTDLQVDSAMGAALIQEYVLMAYGKPLMEMLGGKIKQPDVITLHATGTKITKVRYAGFTIEPFIIENIIIGMQNKNDQWVVNKGEINSELFHSNIAGFLTKKSLDVTVTAVPSARLKKKYPNLTPIIASFGSGDKIGVKIKGSLHSPKLEMVKK